MEYVRVYEGGDGSFGTCLGLCDILHIDMDTDAAAEKSINDEINRVHLRLIQLYPNIRAEQMMQCLHHDIHATIDNLLPLTGQTLHAIYRQGYTYARLCETNEHAYYTFVACFIY